MALTDEEAVLREVTAARGILAEHHPVDPCDAHNAALESVPCKTLRLIASRWADHPDYQPAWRPSVSPPHHGPVAQRVEQTAPETRTGTRVQLPAGPPWARLHCDECE